MIRGWKLLQLVSTRQRRKSGALVQCTESGSQVEAAWQVLQHFQCMHQTKRVLRPAGLLLDGVPATKEHASFSLIQT